MIRNRCIGLLCVTALLGIAPSRADDAASAQPPPAYTEAVTVTATRLTDRDEPAREVPASTTVITRAEIESSGARTLQELLSRIAGAVLYDQQGNAIQTTFDLRGLTGGGVSVLLDGARINDPRNNAILLETLSLDGVERIEVVRGPSAATVGGGSAAGVVNIVTRAGQAGVRTPEVTWAGGSHGSRRLSLEAGGGVRTDRGAAGASAEGFDWLLTASRDASDGFRRNADSRLDRYAASLGYGFGSSSRLWATVHAADDEIGAPGAMTIDEWRSDPDRAPYNRLDESDVSYRQGTVGWRGPLRGPFSLAANLSYLYRDSRTLTTGRAADPALGGFGGFQLDSRVRTVSGAVQSTVSFRTAGLDHLLSFGGEGAGGTSGADACGTHPTALDDCDPASFLNSANRTRRKDTAVFVQDSVRLARGLTFLASGRWDRTQVEYRESVPDSTNDGSRTFSETSWKGGIAWNPLDALGVYTAYGESFAPPTVEDLFAFPTFGSNPDLEPTSTTSYEAGVRGRLTAGSAARSAASAATAALPSFEYAVSVFRMNLDDEIVFDPDSTLGGPFGTNVNAGRSRRQGMEVTIGARPWHRLHASAAYTRTRATFENGGSEGNRVPLVPRNRLSASIDLALPAGVSFRVDHLRVGEQVLANDDGNAEPRLGAYRVVDARAAWRPMDAFERLRRGGGRSVIGALEVFVEARNVLDETYATRGIFAFNFDPTTPMNEVFVTPAPPRTYMAGASVTF